MVKKIPILCTDAAALAVKLARAEVISAYPITPQTSIVEKLSEYVNNGEIDAEYIPVESEHSAMSACLGSSATGARTFTATCGQGLALMHEVLFIAAGMRLPIVMCNTCRSLSPALNIWGDHSDIMASKDCGWIQLFAENAQEIFDFIICAFKISEDERVLLPVVVNCDGFYATHVVEPILALDQEEVDEFLPARKIPPYALHPDHPTTWGAVGFPWIQTEFKKQLENALRNSKPIIKEVLGEFNRRFGRSYNIFETYKMEDAEFVIVHMGSHCGSAKIGIDMLREEGVNAGLLKLTLFKPFPSEELMEILKDRSMIIVIDKSFTPGGTGGHLFTELRCAFYDVKTKPKIVGFIAGIGGRDIKPDEFKYMVKKAIKKKVPKEFEFLQARE